MRAAVALLGMALLSASATGCVEPGAAADVGGADPARDALAAVRQAPDRLVTAGSSKTRTVVRMASGGTRVTVSGSGSFDYARRRGELTVTPPSEASGTPGGEPIIELFTPGTLHMKNRGASVPPDKWVRLDTTELADGNLVTNGATDPLRAAELLRGAREVSYEGKERLGGAVVRHYRGTGDLGAAARAARDAPRGSGRQLTAAAHGFPSDTFSFDAFIDGQGRLRKVRHRFPSVSVTSTTTMYDFGTPVRVRMPEAKDIYTGKIAAVP